MFQINYRQDVDKLDKVEVKKELTKQRAGSKTVEKECTWKQLSHH